MKVLGQMHCVGKALTLTLTLTLIAGISVERISEVRREAFELFLYELYALFDCLKPHPRTGLVSTEAVIGIMEAFRPEVDLEARWIMLEGP